MGRGRRAFSTMFFLGWVLRVFALILCNGWTGWTMAKKRKIKSNSVSGFCRSKSWETKSSRRKQKLIPATDSDRSWPALCVPILQESARINRSELACFPHPILKYNHTMPRRISSLLWCPFFPIDDSLHIHLQLWCWVVSSVRVLALLANKMMAKLRAMRI